jgi:hypothetical protein
MYCTFCFVRVNRRVLDIVEARGASGLSATERQTRHVEVTSMRPCFFSCFCLCFLHLFFSLSFFCVIVTFLAFHFCSSLSRNVMTHHSLPPPLPRSPLPLSLFKSLSISRGSCPSLSPFSCSCPFLGPCPCPCPFPSAYIPSALS